MPNVSSTSLGQIDVLQRTDSGGVSSPLQCAVQSAQVKMVSVLLPLVPTDSSGTDELLRCQEWVEKQLGGPVVERSVKDRLEKIKGFICDHLDHPEADLKDEEAAAADTLDEGSAPNTPSPGSIRTTGAWRGWKNSRKSTTQSSNV